MKHIQNFIVAHRTQLKVIGISFLAGAFWMIAIRFITIKPDNVHYHANMAVFVDGQRLPFDSPTYYEEVQACGGEDDMNPRNRVHLHNLQSHLVHVHDAGATWGHFFANIGLTNGDSVFRIDDKVYVDGQGTEITYMLNGEKVLTTANRTIRNEDVLLVSIGTTDQKVLEEQYSQIQRDASEYNNKYDPGGCSGGKDFTFFERLKKSIGFN